MKMFKLVLLISLLAPFRLAACDLCAIYAATQARGESQRGWFAGAAEQLTHYGTLQRDGHEVSNPTDQRMESSITQLLLGYAFTERFSLQVNVPLIYRSYKRPVEGGMEWGTESGVGDLSLVANFLAWRDDTETVTFTWYLLGGIKFPTGNTGRLREELDEGHEHGDGHEEAESGIHGHDLTLGSGSVDGVIGTSFYLRYKRWFVDGSVQYAIRSEGDYDYRFANDLQWSVGPGRYLLLEHSVTAALQVVASGEYKGLDTLRGAKSNDTGLTAVYVGPQIDVTWQSWLSAEVGFDVPVYIDNTDLQIVSDYRMRAALTLHF